MARELVRVEGLEGLLAQLEGKAGELRLAAEELVAEEAKLVQEDARAHAVEKTGALRDGIEVELEGTTAVVGSRSHHGAANEFGTSKMAAQPFMHPAAELARERFPKNAAARLRKAAE